MGFHGSLQFADQNARWDFRETVQRLDRAVYILEDYHYEDSKRRAHRIVSRSIQNLRTLLFSGAVRFSSPLSLFEWRQNLGALEEAQEILAQ